MVTVRAQFQGQIHVLCSLLTFTMTSIALELYTKLAAAGQTGTLPSRCFPRSLSFPPRARSILSSGIICRGLAPRGHARRKRGGREGASPSTPSSAIKALSTRGSGEEEEVINPGNGRRRRSRRRRRRKRHEQRK